ncbi:hypothetical protein MB14_05460 [Roseivirga ehrenbergii]|uniref:Methyltransferase type 11 domain-containing protein n=2 Tax=Roseivirga ehrenbergii (strain DSM 102268 / JCM 13514 / KCTC 12282 / NCIMB 14502 / KMM 6017) TaxID=279360 RepID=A0A150X8W0_ROSEK|nr:hypothetical protein MB14_05460 [Roseivirga ehrenbergii]
MENQLSCPNGQFGIDIGQNMHSTNLGMITSSIHALAIANGNKVLEIGHGNCHHLPIILEQAENIQFYGLEISETMKAEAELKNKEHLKPQRVEFTRYDGISIPFPDNSFDKVMTANTIYFWKNSLQFLAEIYRVMKPNGTLVIAFAQKEFMKNLPFVREKFQLYNNQDLSDLVSKSSFKLISINDKTEKVKGTANELINRNYAVAVLEK